MLLVCTLTRDEILFEFWSRRMFTVEFPGICWLWDQDARLNNSQEMLDQYYRNNHGQLWVMSLYPVLLVK